MSKQFSLVVALLLLISCSQIVYWQNVSGTHYVKPEELLTPGTAAELIDIVNRARNSGKRVRMTGSGHSYSDVAITDDILLRPTALNNLLTLDNARLHSPYASPDTTLVRVQSGITIYDLSKQLEQRGLALSSMGGHYAQTIVGAAMTGTHGSGLNYGPIHDQIVSLQVVDQTGNLLQIEPNDGITNAESFPGFLEDDPSIAVQLIQDDDLFNAMRVSIGSMGIVYAVVVKTEPKFWLREVRTKTTWEEFKAPDGFLDRLLNGRPLKENGPDPDYYEVWFNPYPNSGGKHTLLLTERFKSYTPLEGDHVRGQPLGNLGEELLKNFGRPLVWILNQNPWLAPAVIDASLDSQRDDEYIDISYNVFTLGALSETDAFAVEAAFSLDQTIAAVERLMELAAIYRQAGMTHNTSVTLRFVKETEAMIAQTQGRPSMIIEIISLVGSNQVDRLFANYQEVFTSEFDARLHWGLDLGYFQSADEPARLLPRWNDWLSLYQNYNSLGVFDGKVTDRLGISMNPR